MFTKGVLSVLGLGSPQKISSFGVDQINLKLNLNTSGSINIPGPQTTMANFSHFAGHIIFLVVFQPPVICSSDLVIHIICSMP